MSDVIDQIRTKFPQYKDVPDEELTVAIGDKYPVYLQHDSAFSNDYRRLKGATSTVTAADSEPPSSRAPAFYTGREGEGGLYTPRGDNLPKLAADPAFVAPLPGGESVENIQAIEDAIYNEEARGTIGPSTLTLAQKIRRGAMARSLLGPTEEERAGRIRLEGAAAPADFARMALRATMLPEAAQEALTQGGGSIGAIVGPKTKAAGEAAGGLLGGIPVAFPALGPVGGRIVAAAFTADIASQIPEIKAQYDQAVKDGDDALATGLQVQALGSLLFAGAAGKHAFIPKAPLEVAAVKAETAGAPATAEAVRAQAETIPPVVETNSPVPDTIPPAGETKAPVAETKPAVPSIVPVRYVGVPTAGGAGGEVIRIETSSDSVSHKVVQTYGGPDGLVKAKADAEALQATISPPAATPAGAPPVVDVTAKPSATRTPEAAAVDPKLIGMGGAIPAEFESGRGTATGIKNAQVDKERVSRGQEPIMGPTRQATADVWDRVMAKIDNDPGWQDRLITEVTAKPRSLTPDETLALDHRYVDLQNEYAKATRDGAQHYADKYEPGIQEARERAAFFETKLNELEQAAKTVGTESGRSLQMRKQMVNEDFTLAAMEAKARASKGFESLTEQEHAEIRTLHEKLAASEKAATEAEQASLARISALEVQKAIAEAKAATAPYEPRVLQAAEKFARFMDKKGDEALARLKERLGRTSTIDPLILADYGILGAAKITRGAVDFAKWTDAMVRDLGEQFREHAQAAWEASQKAFNDELTGFHKGVDKATTEKVRRATTDIAGRTTDIKASIQAKAAKGEGSPLHSDVRKLVRLLVAQDPQITRDALIDTVHGVLKEALPEITRLEAMDAISGRGKFWTPSQDAVSKTVRDLSTQIRLVGHQIDVAAGRPMPRTGYQPEKFSELSVVENKKLHELMKKHGVVVTDPTKQLGSILQALKTRLQTEKVELERRIADKDFSPRRKTREMPLDPAAAKAKAEVTILREKFAEMLSKNRYELKSNVEKAWINLKEGVNLQRSIITAFDVSAVGRQGWFIGAGNFPRAVMAIGPMLRAMRNEKAAVAIEEQILARKNNTSGAYARAKLFIAPRKGKLSGQEEATMSRLASRIPGIAGSQRAYVTFLNLLRADTFDALHDNLIDPTWFQRTVLRREAVVPSDAQLQAIGTYINEATGRGSLGKANVAAETLATVFFSPRLATSRFQLLSAHSAWKGDGFTRYLIAREYAKTLIGLGVVYGLARLAGADVETDRRSSDFGKLKFGNSRVDPLAGLSQTTVFLTRFISGEGKDQGGTVFDAKSSDTLIRFLRNKLAPIAGSALDARDVLVGQKPPPGHPQTLGAIAAGTVVPITYDDIFVIMEEHGLPAGTILEILNLFGFGVQNYQAGQKKR